MSQDHTFVAKLIRSLSRFLSILWDQPTLTQQCRHLKRFILRHLWPVQVHTSMPMIHRLHIKGHPLEQTTTPLVYSMILILRKTMAKENGSPLPTSPCINLVRWTSYPPKNVQAEPVVAIGTRA